MSSFLFEKQQINCSCFDNTLTTARRVFRTQSFHSSSNPNKESKQFFIRYDSQSGKHKKKSLKKQKLSANNLSQSDPRQAHQNHKETLIPDFQGVSYISHNKKDSKTLGFENAESGRYQNLKLQRGKPVNSLRTNRAQPVLIHEPISFPTNVYNNPKPVQTDYQPMNIQIGINTDRLITREFQNDLNQFKFHMESQHNKQGALYQLQSQMSYNIQLESHSIHDQKHKSKVSRKQSLSTNKIVGQNFEHINNKKTSNSNDHEIKNGNNCKDFKDFKDFKFRLSQIRQRQIQRQNTPIHQSQFRNSIASCRQKESISRKLKGRMIPKQIESQRDGSSSDSNQMSEVLGRGLERLTEQRQEIEQLDELMRIEKLKSQTMVTQASQIRNSQIKTMTDYSGSFISPKSNQHKNMSFGGHKYGVTGMSYQHIEDLGFGRTDSQRRPFY